MYKQPSSYGYRANTLKSMADSIEQDNRDTLLFYLNTIAELEAKVRELEDEVSGMYTQEQWDEVQDDLTQANTDAEYWQAEYEREWTRAEDGESTVEELKEELEDYRLIEHKTGKSPEEVIDLVSNLQGVVDAIRTRATCNKCGEVVG